MLMLMLLLCLCLCQDIIRIVFYIVTPQLSAQVVFFILNGDNPVIVYISVCPHPLDARLKRRRTAGKCNVSH
jgi:hypothetical protein